MSELMIPMDGSGYVFFISIVEGQTLGTRTTKEGYSVRLLGYHADGKQLGLRTLRGVYYLKFKAVSLVNEAVDALELALSTGSHRITFYGVGGIDFVPVELSEGI